MNKTCSQAKTLMHSRGIGCAPTNCRLGGGGADHKKSALIRRGRRVAIDLTNSPPEVDGLNGAASISWSWGICLS